MYKKIIKFDDTTIEEVKFHHHKCANVLLRYMIKKIYMKECFSCFYQKIISVQAILIDSVCKEDGNYYSRVFLEKCFQ